jgi:hypothetical protein
MKKLLILILALVIFVAGCTVVPESKETEVTTNSYFDWSSLGTFEPPEMDWSKITTATTTAETTHQEIMVWIPQKGEKYHLSSKCSGMKNPTRVTISKARRYGYEPCSKCYN